MTGFFRPRALLSHVCLRQWLLIALLQNGIAMAQPSELQEQVRHLIEPRLPPRSQQVQIDIGQPAARISACERPLPYLVHPEQSVLGRVAVGVGCEGNEGVTGYLQVSVRAVGDYVVSRQRIAVGDVVKANMLEIRRGALERLPKGSVLKPEQIIGLQASRSFSRGAPLALNNFRPRWLVERNQRVVLQAKGAGFTIRRDGKALDNGRLGSSVRVLSSDGKLLNAQVVGQSELLLRY
ncbi:flagellar basal body P-ring formation chaperone FlgA [Pseudomonas sp. ABY48]|uniref:flagellar basal body P-ring formation chaperone FlgA n=1 Tax=Pseudomonas sp. ABY48 TaxID=3402865 RepID=UPI003B432C2F